MFLIVVRPLDTVTVAIMPHKESGLYSFVNLTKFHICPCKFISIGDALADLDNRIQQGSVLSYEIIKNN